MLTVLAVPVAAGASKSSNSKFVLNVCMCFQFVTDEGGIPDPFRNWPDTAAALGLKVNVYNTGAPEVQIGTGSWSGLNDMVQAHKLWSRMIGVDRTGSEESVVQVRWVASDIRPSGNRPRVRTYSVKNLLSNWDKTRTAKVVSAAGIKVDEKLRITEEEEKALSDFWVFHSTPAAPREQANNGVRISNISVSDFALIATRHPSLARRVGLVCDLNIDVSSRDMPDGKLLLRASVKDPSVKIPFTACALREESEKVFFLPRPAPSDETCVGDDGGILRMRKRMPNNSLASIFYLETLDYVASLHREEVAKEVSPAATTSHREVSSGLALIHDGVGLDSEKYKYGTVTLANLRQEYILFAGALRYGFRVDVRENREWFSLCRRRVTYRTDENSWEEEDEGIFTPNPVTNDGGGAQQHEELLRWNTSGSLVVSMPGKVSDGNEPNPTFLGSVRYAERLPLSGLAALRFRHDYAMRLRSVFAGGYSLKLTDILTTAADTDDEGVTAIHRFRRSESVAAPLIVTDSKNPGICNDPGKDGDHPNEHRVYCSADMRAGKVAVRYVHPPNVTEEDILLSGELDLMKPEDSYRLFKRFADLAPSSASDVRGLPDPDAIGASFRFRLRGQNVVGSAQTCPVNSTNVDLVPGCDTSGSLSFYRDRKTWPSFRPIRLEVSAVRQGPTQVRFDWKAGRIAVRLAPGATVESHIQTIPRTTAKRQLKEDDGVPLFSSLKDDYLVPSRLLLSSVSTRSVERLTPTEVGVASEAFFLSKHATKKPTTAPIWGAPEVLRTQGQNLAIIRDSPVFDQWTTGKLSLSYTWQELSCANVPGGLTFAKKEGNSEEISVGEDLGTNDGELSLSPRQLDFSVLFDDSKARDISAHLVAHGHFADCFGATLSAGRQEAGAKKEFVIPNCAVPRPPVVKYALPLTSLKRESETRVRRSVRKSNAIRLYLSGCWSDTGRGELLGVVCAPHSQESLSDSDRRQNEKFFSQWGAEVLFRTKALGDGPFAHHFEWATVLFDGVQAVTPEEARKNIRVDRPAIVAGHKVHYDEIRKCWYSDISVPAARNSFLPWIRLGLARFQPDSIFGCHVSPVVLSAFCQFLPDRTVTVVRSGADPRMLQISVAGIGPVDDCDIELHTHAVLEVSVLQPFSSGSVGSTEVHVDEHGRLWREATSASLAWEAKDDGSGAYSGDIWLSRSDDNVRLLIRESLNSSLTGSDKGGRAILLEALLI